MSRAPGSWGCRAARPASLLPLLAAGGALLLGGCTTAVHPPPSPPAAEAVEVYLLDHGRTSSLVLPVADGDLRRWAYGDWRWYALGRRTPATAVAALSWPTRGALGREELAGPPGVETVRAGVAVEIDALHPLRVGRAAVEALAARLEGLFERQIDTLVVNGESGLAFVHHPVPYTLRHSSNRKVAAWLRELGCEVDGPALLSRWRVGRAAPRPGASATIPLD